MDTPAVQPVPPQQPKNNLHIFINIFIFLLGILVGLTLDKTTIFSAIRIPYLGAAPTPTLLPTPTPTPDTTANWKTYTNTKVGYSIQYPPSWTLGETTNNAGGIDLTGPGIATKDTFAASNLLLLVNDAATKIGTTQFCTQVGCLDKDKWQKLLIDEVTGYRTDFFPPAPGGLDESKKVRVVLFIDKQGKNVYAISTSALVEKENEFFIRFDQILSTFRFVGQK